MNAPDSLPFDDTDPDARDEADLPLVLLVDDEVRSQDAMRRTLDEDFRILCASSAEEARAARAPRGGGHPVRPAHARADRRGVPARGARALVS